MCDYRTRHYKPVYLNTQITRGYEVFTAMWWMAQVCWGVTLSHWVIGSWRFESAQCLHLEGSRMSDRASSLHQKL